MKPKLFLLLGAFNAGMIAVSLKNHEPPGWLWISTTVVVLLAGLFSK